MNRVIYEENEAGVHYEKYLLHANRLEIYTKENNLMIKGGYYMEVLGSDGKKLVWKVIDGHVVNDPNNNGEIGLQGFGFYLFDGYGGEDRRIASIYLFDPVN